MTRVVMPNAPSPHPAAARALLGYAPGAELCDVSSDDYAYWRLVSDVWAAAQDTIFVEHDVIVRRDVIEAFESCPRDWCVFSYDYPLAAMGLAKDRRLFSPLGCSRFRASVMEGWPDACGSRPVRWWNTADRLGAGLLLRWKPAPRPHIHQPPVEHLNRGEHGPPWKRSRPELVAR